MRVEGATVELLVLLHELLVLDLVVTFLLVVHLPFKEVH